MSLVTNNNAVQVAPVKLGKAAIFEQKRKESLSMNIDENAGLSRLNALAYACRATLDARWAKTQAEDAKRGPDAPRRVHYLSMEFLMGRALTNALAALQVSDEARAEAALVADREPDAALGNGGLGRLAACFLDSFAELELPSFGYGLRYRHGMFAQRIEGGRQTEVPDQWLKNGNAWEQMRPELQYSIGFGGSVEMASGLARRWVPASTVHARAYDFIVPGHATERVSTLRQWHAEASRPIDYAAFSRGDHFAAGAHVLAADSLNWVLYPDDSTEAGRELRLKQEFFLVSASLQDMIARHLRKDQNIESFGKKNVVHLNDTHPALAPIELMRLLLDEHGLTWDAAWKVTREATSYTNHTLMPEALETWPVRMMEALLPRHLELVYEINQRFLDEVRAKFPGDAKRLETLSLIDERGERRVRMANIAIVASTRVNGVSALHSQLMVDTIFADFAALWPDRFMNVTNGVTPRRWLEQANPSLSSLLDSTIGQKWRRDLSQLSRLGDHANDARLGEKFLAVKRESKVKLAEYVRRELGIAINIDSLFDVHIKRIHEYKRQLLNVLHVIARYQAIIANPNANWVPRTVIFAGKAASAYVMAKNVIRLIHDVARVINSDPRVGDKLKLVFLPNYSVSLAEMIIPAADLSQQISTAGTEASGTGNMKFGLNGAITIGTWDGANIEMAEHMGVENMFVFGLRTPQVAALKAVGYDPRLYIEENKTLANVIAAIGNGAFSWDEPERYRSIVQSLTQHDPYLLMADFADYVDTQSKVDALYVVQKAWAERALRNIAGMGFFSTDRTIAEYVQKVWDKPRL
ncbi:MAG: glycogen/starch/alpha-glucan phosphorylase [Casimicrobium sp.]